MAPTPLDVAVGQTPPAVANVSTQSSSPSPRISPEDEAASTGIAVSETTPATSSTIGRRMKQLALLESLASDHPRPATMAPLDLGRAGPHVEQFAAHAPVQRGPPLPAGFMHHPNNRFQMAVPYPGPGPMPFPHTLGRRFQPPQVDPFQVRPRTSNAVFPPSLHMPMQTHAPHSMSMHQGQLLAMMGGNPNFNGMMPLQPPPMAPPMQLPNMRHFPEANVTPLLHTPQHDRQALRVIPPFASSQIEPGPLTAPTMPPNFGLPGPAILPSKANAANLLSILNVGQSSSMNNSIPIPQYSAGVGSPMPPGALINGTMHR
ncbi:hypothetical protein BD410DRAFT_780922 [Rickenella mellea]|uniref:Uncharacterized protein n=1 Tax=Rickenella mellea TaxID=50990 RepID=A0A4Y7QM05_9AGAM|nr:hypothetical protein BD410DRAFT_780922 [Rickenella mellea]